jgi:hypothetical protein
MELRFQTARTTKDLDFTVRIPSTGRVDLLLKQELEHLGVGFVSLTEA